MPVLILSKKYLLVLIFLNTVLCLNSQKWIEVRDSMTSTNLKQYFEEYKESTDTLKTLSHRGVKAFDRWLYKWENRLDENGKLPPAGINQENFQTYLRSSNTTNRSKPIISNWTSEGPNTTSGGYNGLGRVNSFATDPGNVNVLYVGSAGGGIWKSVNDGATWTPKSDAIGAMGVSSILVNPQNTNIIYIATGDGDGSDNYSVGVLKSLDGGDTWNTTGLNWSQSNARLIRKLVFDPFNANVILAVGSYGIHRSIDAGATWSRTSSAGSFYDMEYTVDNGVATFFAVLSNNVFKSTDNGVTWVSVKTFNDTNRLALATSAASANYVYILASLSSNSGLQGIHRSTDNGVTWNLQTATPNLLNSSSNGSGTGGQGWYDLVICASPVNPDIIHIGGVNHWKSVNGGVKWTLKSHWSGGPVTVHADKHYLEYHGSVLWEGNDGGIYRSTNGGDGWSDKSNGLVIGQIYRLDISQTDNKLILGLQDNGTKARSGVGAWANSIGGDGMLCRIAPDTSTHMYGAIQYGELRRSLNGGNSWTDIQNSIPGAPAGAWITPYVIDHQNTSRIYAGYKKVYASNNRGTTWDTLSGSWSSNITILEVASSNPNIIYAGTNNDVRYTLDGGLTWVSIAEPNSKIEDLIINPNDPSILYATCSNYTSNAKVYKSINRGATWVNISNNSLPNLPANCIKYYNNGRNGLFVGMDVGLYFLDDDEVTWQLSSVGLPNVAIYDVVIKKSGKIAVATYGRGVWQADLPAELPLCTNGGNLIVTPSLNTNQIKMDWAPSTGSFGGYEWNISTNNSPGTLTSFISVDSAATVTQTLYTKYYAHVRTKCTASEKTSFVSFGPFVSGVPCAPVNFIDNSTPIYLVYNASVNGEGSFANTINEAPNGSIIHFCDQMGIDTFLIDAALVLNKSISILNESTAYKSLVHTQNNSSMFNVNANGVLSLKAVNLIPSLTSPFPSIVNSGLIKLENITIFPSANGVNQINNQGIMNNMGSVIFKK